MRDLPYLESKIAATLSVGPTISLCQRGALWIRWTQVYHGVQLLCAHPLDVEPRAAQAVGLGGAAPPLQRFGRHPAPRGGLVHLPAGLRRETRRLVHGATRALFAPAPATARSVSREFSRMDRRVVGGDVADSRVVASTLSQKTIQTKWLRCAGSEVVARYT